MLLAMKPSIGAIALALALALAIVACGARGSTTATPIENAAGSGAEAANREACAATYNEVPVGAACTTEVQCAFAEGSCTCAPRSYCGGVEPSPEMLETLARPTWQCTPVRTDGCPDQPPSGSCGEEGKECGYGSCCFSVSTCTQGQWAAGPSQCPP